MKLTRWPLKAILAPLIAVMTIFSFALVLVITLSSKALEVVSFALAAFAVPVFIYGMGRSGCMLLILAWLMSTLGLTLVADWLWRGLDNVRAMILRRVLG